MAAASKKLNDALHAGEMYVGGVCRLVMRNRGLASSLVVEHMDCFQYLNDILHFQNLPTLTKVSLLIMNTYLILQNLREKLLEGLIIPIYYRCISNLHSSSLQSVCVSQSINVSEYWQQDLMPSLALHLLAQAISNFEDEKVCCSILNATEPGIAPRISVSLVTY